jgi:hypothetical protein
MHIMTYLLFISMFEAYFQFNYRAKEVFFRYNI